MKTEQKIYAALGILVISAGGLYLTNKSNKEALAGHSAVAASADLPPIAVPKDEVEKVTKFEIKNADKTNVTLEKKGDDWMVTAPVQAKANSANVRSLLDNLKELKLKESIDKGEGMYQQYELSDDKGLHVVAYKGADKALDMYLGKSGSRGQMGRIAGKPGVYIVGGYQSYLYTRELKNWRETSILKFEDANVIQADVTNAHGLFSFSKNGDKWSGTYTKRDKDGKLGDPAKKWEKFDDGKLKDMLRAFKALSADDFGDDKSDTGLANAEKEGGIVHVKLKDGAGDLTVKIGKTSKGTNRYAIKDGGDGTIYTLSSWSADWATAERSKFEKADDKKGDKDKSPPPPPPHAGGGEDDGN